MGTSRKLPFLPLIDITLRASFRSAPLFLGLAAIAFVATVAATMAKVALPAPEFHDVGPQNIIAAFQHAMLIWLIQAPAVVAKFLAAGLIAHRTWRWLLQSRASLRSDVKAIRRSFRTITSLALLWHSIASLPIVPTGLRNVTVPFEWYSDVTWIPETVLALFLYYSTVRPILTLGGLILLFLGLRWCLAVPAALSERLGPVAALRRSTALTAGHCLRLLGLFLILGLSGLMVSEFLGQIEMYGLTAGWLVTPSKISRAVQWMLGLILAAVGTTAIYAEARRIEEATIPRGATEPAPTAQP